MSFSVIRADEDFKLKHHITAQQCVVLTVDDRFAGYAAWDTIDHNYVIDSYEFYSENERYLDAMMRAVAFEGIGNYIRYLFCTANNESDAACMLNGVFQKNDGLMCDGMDNIGSDGQMLCVDIMKCFSQHSCGADHAE